MRNIIESGNARLLVVDQRPIWLSPRIRQDIRSGNEDVTIDLALLSQQQFLGQRSLRDTLPWNFDEVVRLRRIAREASRELVEFAKNDLDARRYCTVVSGSVAKGLVRSPQSDDPSDIDIDLIVDTPIATQEKEAIKNRMLYETSKKFGVKIDTNLQNTVSIRRSKGFQARTQLWGNAYPITNVGNMFEEVILVGRENERYLQLNKRVKKASLRILLLVANGENEKANQVLTAPTCEYEAIRHYIEQLNIPDDEALAQQKAKMLVEMLTH